MPFLPNRPFPSHDRRSTEKLHYSTTGTPTCPRLEVPHLTLTVCSPCLPCPSMPQSSKSMPCPVCLLCFADSWYECGMIFCPPRRIRVRIQARHTAFVLASASVGQWSGLPLAGGVVLDWHWPKIIAPSSMESWNHGSMPLRGSQVARMLGRQYQKTLPNATSPAPDHSVVSRRKSLSTPLTCVYCRIIKFLGILLHF